MADPAAMARFLANEGQKLPPKPKRETPSPKREPMKRGKGPRKVSIKQHYRNGFLNGVKAERLSNMALNPRRPLGVDLPLFWCEADCGYGTDDIDEAKRMHLHHGDTQRSMGTRATPEAWGVDDPGGLVLLCSSCHRAAHKPLDEPQWTEAP